VSGDIRVRPTRNRGNGDGTRDGNLETATDGNDEGDEVGESGVK